jgi:hypothetical protein
MGRLKRTIYNERFVARLKVARLKRTILNERFVTRLKVARLKRTIFNERFVARLKRIIFNEHVCGAVKSGGSKTNHFLRACLWRD